jgi:methyl-accepting chemotaxis protein
MIADKDFNIIYTNGALNSMMQIAESDLREQLPNFNSKELVGKKMYVFHKDVSHQRHLLTDLKNTYKNQVKAGSRTFVLTANPIQSSEGVRLGTVVEWQDRSAEVLIEKEID